jgi:hypothetical protein
MIVISRSVLLLFLGSLVAGCASLINGSTQDVPVKIPEGTVVTNWRGDQMPVMRQAKYSDTSSYITLHRGKKYELKFDYHGESIETVFTSAVEPGWIPVDALFYIVPLIVDLANQNINSFEGIAIHFSNDRSDLKRTGQTYIEPYQAGQLIEPRQGFSFELLAGRNDTHSSFEFLLPFPNGVGFGVGYDLSNQLSVLGSYHFTTGLDLTPATYQKGYTAISTIQCEGHYNFQSGFSLGVGAGISHVQIDRPYYDSADFRIVQPDISKTIPVITPIIGYYGTVSFIELRYVFGLGDITFQHSADLSRLRILSLNYGLHFHL